MEIQFFQMLHLHQNMDEVVQEVMANLLQEEEDQEGPEKITPGLQAGKMSGAGAKKYYPSGEFCVVIMSYYVVLKCSAHEVISIFN